MQTLLIECVIRSTLIAAFAGLVLFVMRIKAPAAKHAIWTAVMLAMLLLPLIPKIPLPLLRPAVREAATPVVLPVGQAPGLRGAPGPALPSSHPEARRISWPIAFYLAGVLVFLIRLGIGAARVRALADGTTPVAAPITVGWLRPKVILPPDSSQWPQAKLQAVLAHEREHARRRDPLWQLFALLNRALFWFHPLAWWLERKLSGLAEEACDTAVLARGYDPRDYSEFLLDLARSVSRTGARVEALGVAMPGIGLEHRIRQMLSGRLAPRVSRARMASAAALCTLAGAIFSAGTLVQAQSGSKDHLEFEVASVRPSNPNGGGFKSKGARDGGVPSVLSRARFSYSANLLGLIMEAYHVTACRPAQGRDTCPLISGGPAWIDKDDFDVQAKISEGTPEYTLRQLADGQAPEIQQMLQALLADRFNLKVHREKKRMSVYALGIAKNGPRLRRSGEAEKIRLPNGNVIEAGGISFRPVVQPNGDRVIRFDAKNSSMQVVADGLSSFLFTRPVLDRTGLKGDFDFTVEYAAEGNQPILDLSGPELFTGLQEQAGLKLEATRAAVDILIIDHAEKPSEN